MQRRPPHPDRLGLQRINQRDGIQLASAARHGTHGAEDLAMRVEKKVLRSSDRSASRRCFGSSRMRPSNARSASGLAGATSG